MSDSVGKVQLDIEVNPKSIVRETSSMARAFSSGMKKPFTDMGNFVKNSMSRMADSFRSMVPGSRVSQDIEEVTAKFSGSVSKMESRLAQLQSSLENSQKRISTLTAEMLSLHAEREAIMKGIAESTWAFPEMTKEESIDLAIAENAELKKLDKQITLLEEKMKPWIARKSQATEETRRLTAAVNHLERATVQVGDTTEKAQGKMGGFATSMQKAFMRVLRQVFVFALLYKAIRGLGSYVGSALKTNQAFVNSLAQVKTNLQVAFMPIYQAVLPALQTMMRWLATATTYIAAFVSALFGKTYQQSFKAARGLNAAKAAMEGYGKATKKTLGALSGFDELHVLGGSDGDTGGDMGAAGHELVAPPVDENSITMAEKFGAKIREIFLPVWEWLKNLWNTFIGFIGWLWGDGSKGFNAFALILLSLAAAFVIVKVATMAFGVVMGIVTSPITLVVLAVAALIAVGILLWKNWDKISIWIVGAWGWMKETAVGVFNAIKETITNAFNTVKAAVLNIWTNITTWIGNAWTNIKNIFSLSNVTSFFNGVLTGIQNVFASIPNWFKSKFTEAWNAVKNVFSAGGQIFTGIKEGIASTFKTIVNGLVGGINTIIRAPFNAINGMLNKIRDVGVMGLKPFQYLWGYNPLRVPQIPLLARGGIVDQPTLAMIGEKRKKEAVLPLEQNTGWMDTLAAKIAAVISGQAGGDDGPLIVQVVIGGNKILEEIIDAAERKNAKAGRTVIQVGV